MIICSFGVGEGRNIAGLPSVTLADGLCVGWGEGKHSLSSIFFSVAQQLNWGPCFLLVKVFKSHTIRHTHLVGLI